MINQEQVCIWFKELEGHSRIELMCALLDSCLPLELRFLGTYLEYGAGKHYTHLQRWEKDANNNNSISALTNLSDTKIRRRLCLFLALLHSHNRSVAIKLFDILNIYENFGNNESDIKEDSKSNWSDDRTSRNEMKLLLTMAFLHPAFDFGQRETLRKKLQSFLNICCVPEEKEKVNKVNNSMSQVSQGSSNPELSSVFAPSQATTSFTKSTCVNVSSIEQKAIVTKQPLLPLHLTPSDVHYPLLKYSIPLAHFPTQCSVLPPQPVQQNPQPMQQILLQRQAVPLMHSNELNSLHPMNTVASSPYQHTTISTSVAHGVVPTRQLDMKNIVLHSLPVISTVTPIDVITMPPVVGENCNQNMWNRQFIPNGNVFLPNQNEIKTHVLTDGPLAPTSLVEGNNVFGNSNSSCPLADPQCATKLNGSIPDFEKNLALQNSNANRDVFRRSYSESDACDKNAIPNNIYRNPNEVSQSVRNNATIMPVYFPFSNHSKNGTSVFACHGLTSITSPTFYSKPSMMTKFTSNMYYGADHNEIIPTGLNGGFIPQPVVLSDSVNSHPTASFVSPPALIPERASSVPLLQPKHDMVQHLTNYQPTPKFHNHDNLGSTATQTLNISIHDNLDSICVSPAASQSPRPSPYQSPGHSPMVPRKSYIDSKDSLSSAALWLKSVRLHKYSSNFDGYTFQMMKDLTEEDLERLGLTVGARKKFLQCVEHLNKRGFKEFGETDTDDYLSSNSSLVLSPTLQRSTPPSVSSPLLLSTSESSINSFHENTYGGVDHPLPIVSHGSEASTGLTKPHSIVEKKPAEESKRNPSRKRDQNATCYNCGAAGHYGDECTEQTMEAQTYSRYAFHLDFSNAVVLPVGNSTDATGDS